MTRNEKKQAVLEALKLLKKNKGLDFKVTKTRIERINRSWGGFEILWIDFDYTIKGEEKHCQFGFDDIWFDPNDLGHDGVQDLQLPKNLNEYQIVLLKIAYGFYTWYKMNYQ